MDRVVIIDSVTKKVFIQAWRKEYKATVECQKIIREIEIAEMTLKPTQRLSNRLAVWDKKVKDASNVIIELIKEGLPENMVDLCPELNDIAGYINDCYGALYPYYKDYKPA